HIASNTQLMQELPLELEMKFRKEANAKKRRRFSPNIKRSKERRKRTKKDT
ncbi:hypothetical protein CU098_012021, partial [Rhizopus stolonifer]